MFLDTTIMCLFLKNIQKLYPTSREIRQVGTEIIGLKSELAIIESISIINTLMNDVFNQPYKLILGNVLIFDKLKTIFTS